MEEMEVTGTVTSIEMEWGTDLMSGFRMLPKFEARALLKESGRMIGRAAIRAVNSVETWAGDRLEQRAMRRIPSVLTDSVLPVIPTVEQLGLEVI